MIKDVGSHLQPKKAIPVSLILILLWIHHAEAHSWIVEPETYNTVYKTNTCVAEQCGLPCPTKWTNMKNSRASPARQYRRGQSIKVIWVRNSHNGGIVRLGLVPVEAMWNKNAHARLALYYGCWDDNTVRCKALNYRWCGTDKEGYALSATMNVPNCLPDGDYVFSYSWFGGLHYSRNRGGFPDFNHCSHVSVKGGPFGSCTPQFKVGSGPSASRDRTQCQTAAIEPGTCIKKACPTRSFYGRPKPFMNGAPPSFTTADVAYVRENPRSTLSTWPISGNGGGRPSGSSGPRRTASPSATPRGRGQNPEVTQCSGGVCCSVGCKGCGGPNCQRLKTKASDLCCTTAVRKSGRSCETFPPPCTCPLGKADNCLPSK